MSKTKKAATVFLSVLTALLSVYLLLCTLVQLVFLRPSAYMDDVFCKEMKASVLERVKICLSGNDAELELPTDELYSSLNEQEILLYEQNYTKEFLRCMMTGDKFSYSDFDCSCLREPAEKLLQLYAQENEYELSDEKLDEIVLYLQSSVNSTLHYIPGIILGFRGAFSARVQQIAKLTDYWVPAAIGLTAGWILLWIINRAQKPSSWLFTAVSLLWMAVCLIALPAWMAVLYRVPERLVLSHGPLYYLVAGAWNTVAGKTAAAFLTALGVLTVALAVLIACKAKGMVKKATVDRQKKSDFS